MFGTKCVTSLWVENVYSMFESLKTVFTPFTKTIYSDWKLYSLSLPILFLVSKVWLCILYDVELASLLVLSLWSYTFEYVNSYCAWFWCYLVLIEELLMSQNLSIFTIYCAWNGLLYDLLYKDMIFIEKIWSLSNIFVLSDFWLLLVCNCVFVLTGFREDEN